MRGRYKKFENFYSKIKIKKDLLKLINFKKVKKDINKNFRSYLKGEIEINCLVVRHQPVSTFNPAFLADLVRASHIPVGSMVPSVGL